MTTVAPPPDNPGPSMRPRPREFRRLTRVGVSADVAAVLAAAIPPGAPARYTRRDDDERAYWRAQAARTRALPEAYAARAAAQRERRAAS